MASASDVEFFSLIGVSGVNTILVDGGGKLTLDGIIVTHANGATGRGVTVNFDGILEMYGGKISGNSLYGNGGGVFSSGTFRLFGGEISNNAAGTNVAGNNGAGGGVYNSGVFIMRGDVVISNNRDASGGGVYSTTGRFEMLSGVVSGNTASSNGGVYSIGGTLELFGGVVSGNTASSNGGVYSIGGTLELSDCEISDNRAVNGGVWRSGAFDMSKVIVFDNHASSNGGGIYKDGSGSTFSMFGGAVSSNTAGSAGGGVCINNGNFDMRNDGVISDNTAPNGGVYLVNGLVNLYSGKISSNGTTVGGGIWITGTYTNLARLTVDVDAEFSDNHALTAYDRQSTDDATYNSHIGDEGVGVTWTDPFTQGYNNYDISYIRGSQIQGRSVDVIGGKTKWPTYVSGATVAIIADAPSEGKTFDMWTAIPDVEFADPTNPITTFIMPARSVEIKANFHDSVDVVLTRIDVTVDPSKLVYVEGDVLDLSGMIVIATYSDGTTKDVTISTVTNPSNGALLNTLGTMTVMVSYTENDVTRTSSFSIIVNPQTPPSNDATLSILMVSEGTLNPAFDPVITSYSVSVENSVDSVVITAEVSDVAASVVGDGMMSLGVGVNSFAITVTAEDGSEQTYTVVVTREAAFWIDYDNYDEDLFTVIYRPSLHGTFAVVSVGDLYYGDVTPGAPSVLGEVGWRFVRWDPVWSSMVSGDVVYTALWEEVSFSVRFVDWDGALFKSQEVPYNADAAAPVNPSRSGYTFTGWDRTFTSVTADLTVTAQYQTTSTTSPSPSAAPAPSISHSPSDASTPVTAPSDTSIVYPAPSSSTAPAPSTSPSDIDQRTFDNDTDGVDGTSNTWM